LKPFWELKSGAFFKHFACLDPLQTSIQVTNHSLGVSAIKKKKKMMMVIHVVSSVIGDEEEYHRNDLSKP
jgi:hypothetical protein